MMGQNVDLLCVLQNLCPELPVNFHFRKLAHFITEPFRGTIGPGQSQEVVLSFTARQQGSFQLCQMLDVLGHVHQSSDNTAVTEFKLRSFHTVALQLSALCCSETVPKPNPDTIPAVTKTLVPHLGFSLVIWLGSLRWSRDRGINRFTQTSSYSSCKHGCREQRGEMLDNRKKCYRSCPGKKTSIPLQFKNQASEVMSAVPSNSQEVADCSRTLTAQEFYQVVIGPLFLDFGEVCVQSMCVQKLELTNHLSVYIWVQLEMDGPELQGSSPLSHVLPPCSHSTLPLTFQCNKLGHFHRTVSYTVNQQHPGQILVQAQVVPLALELSTNLLVIRSAPPLLAQSGYRSSVTLRNHRNHAAEFTWRPIVRENGVLFSIRPATGTVEPYRELDCDVVWHPSFSSPADGDFDLCVHEGNTQRLHCVAKVESTSVQLGETQVMFGSVPLNMPSIRTAILHNTGQSHAYYQVLDVCPLPGLVVGPYEGVVPSRGQAVLKIHFTPDAVIRFDTRVEIALRGMKSIELRVGGSVEPPNLDISVSLFQFHGVHAGSRRVIPFTLTNCSSAAARVTFNLSPYADFSLQLPQPSHKKEPGVSVMEVQGYQTKDCSLIFSPTQAASLRLRPASDGQRSEMAHWSSVSLPYSVLCFHLLLSVSGQLEAHGPATQPLCQHGSTTVPVHTGHSAVCSTGNVPVKLQLHVEPWASQSDVHTKTVELKACNTAPTEDRRECELCTVTPSSGRLGPSQSICVEVSIRPEAIRTASDRLIKLSLPLYLGDKDGERGEEEKERQPYRELAITITVQRPSITFHPPQILLCPVPLETMQCQTHPSGCGISKWDQDIS
ncbi:unnamed protein product [Pleuronectes platessa]|uniref:Abnormal spindle-like microcephaly-associated protein ASH domain-containing protein n=1 Tax=Pleuronectes platessa TaxID=8262 RepID=A0A9N7U2Q6_PLEPL|nr:unnamed protein product [Pleuronectes platessa]